MKPNMYQMIVPIPKIGNRRNFLMTINIIIQRSKKKNPSGRTNGNNEQIIDEAMYFFLTNSNRLTTNIVAKNISVKGFTDNKRK